jgi:predicted naringenin-chalcone synthase
MSCVTGRPSAGNLHKELHQIPTLEGQWLMWAVCSYRYSRYKELSRNLVNISFFGTLSAVACVMLDAQTKVKVKGKAIPVTGFRGP